MLCNRSPDEFVVSISQSQQDHGEKPLVIVVHETGLWWSFDGDVFFPSSAPLTVEIVRADRTRPYLGQIFRVTVRIDRTSLTVDSVWAV